MTRAAPLAAFMLSAAMIALGQQTAGALGDRVETGPCGIGNTGSVSNSPVTCNFGLTEEQLKQVTKAAVMGATEPLAHQISEISKTLGVTEDAAKKLLKIVGEDPNIPEDKLAEALSKVAADYQRLQVQLAALNPDNPQARELVEQTKPEIDAGHFDRAHELLRQATQAQIAAAQQAYQLERQARAAGDTQMLGAANATAAEGDVAMTERRYVVAAQLFGQAADYVPSGHASEQGGYLLREADALYQQGDERGDNDALRRSIEVYGRALANYPRSQAALDWAKAQMGLGNALGALGERECGTARLEEAVKAYRAALEERTRERVPLEWAATQNNLGKALMWLGERERGTARLEEAVAAYRAAQEERARDRAPLDWATTQVFLGNALETLGERESGTARLEEAATAYRAVVKEPLLKRVPLFLWARAQNGICYELAKWGERENGTTRLEEAVSDCRAALKERPRDQDRLGWAATQDSLGYALRALGERESGTKLLDEAVAAYRAALEERTPERVPLRWAATFGNQGIAMMLIADRTHDGALAETAFQQIQTAVERLRSDCQEAWAVYYEEQLPKAQAIRDRLK